MALQVLLLQHGKLVGRHFAAIRAELAIEFAARLALICTLTALVAQYYDTPAPALTAYLAFILNRPDRATSVLLSVALTVVVIFAWRLPGGPDGYLRDVMAGLFALAYLPFLAVFIVALLTPVDGAQRVVIFIDAIRRNFLGDDFAKNTIHPSIIHSCHAPHGGGKEIEVVAPAL